MSAVSWLRRPSALLVAATSLYSATVWTQTQPAPAPATHDRVDVDLLAPYRLSRFAAGTAAR